MKTRTVAASTGEFPDDSPQKILLVDDLPVNLSLLAKTVPPLDKGIMTA
ncbi:MAG: hypothetical protein ACO3N7_01815 [Kiritimatiellia bacterium]